MSGYGSSKGAIYTRTARISSSQRSSGTSSNFVYDFGNNLQGVTRLSLKYVNFFNNFDNINPWGNQFTMSTTFGGVPFTGTITIPVGRYTLTSFLNALVTAIAAPLGGTISYSIDPITGYVTLTWSASAGVTQIVLSPLTGFTFPLFYAGFNALAPLTFNATTPSYTAAGFAKLYGPQNVYIISRALAPGNCVDNGGGFCDLLAEVPVTAEYKGLNLWECKVDVLCEINYGKPRDITRTDILLTDREGHVLDLKDGSLTIDLKVWTNRI